MRYSARMHGAETDTPLNVRLPPELLWRVGRIAADRGVSLSEIVHAAIVDGLNKLDVGGRAAVENALASARSERRDKAGI